MSTNCTIKGFSIPFKDEYQKMDFLVDYFKVEDNDAFYEMVYDSEKKKNQWSVYYDNNSVKGLVYWLEDEWDSFYLDFSVTRNMMNDAIKEIPNEFENMVNMDQFKAFAHLYYNGTDAPFMF